MVLSGATCGADACGLDVERPHQGLGGALIHPANDQAASGPVMRRERLGGLLNYYYREAA